MQSRRDEYPVDEIHVIHEPGVDHKAVHLPHWPYQYVELWWEEEDKNSVEQRRSHS